MKTRTMGRILLGLLPALATASLAATQVRTVTFGSGLGRAASETHGVRLAPGLPLAGHTDLGAGTSAVSFGFWHLRRQAVSAVGEDQVPLVNKLHTNYPNPFNPRTTIGFTLEREARVRVEVYDLRGRKVDTVFDGVQPAGLHRLEYQPRGLASGSYVILMRAGSFRATQRMTLVK